MSGLTLTCANRPGHVAYSVGRIIEEPEETGLCTFVEIDHKIFWPFHRFKRGSCQLLAERMTDRSGGLSLPVNSVVMLNDRPDITIAVKQQVTNQPVHMGILLSSKC